MIVGERGDLNRELERAGAAAEGGVRADALPESRRILPAFQIAREKAVGLRWIEHPTKQSLELWARLRGQSGEVALDRLSVDDRRHGSFRDGVRERAALQIRMRRQQRV